MDQTDQSRAKSFLHPNPQEGFQIGDPSRKHQGKTDANEEPLLSLVRKHIQRLHPQKVAAKTAESMQQQDNTDGSVRTPKLSVARNNFGQRIKPLKRLKGQSFQNLFQQSSLGDSDIEGEAPFEEDEDLRDVVPLSSSKSTTPEPLSDDLEGVALIEQEQSNSFTPILFIDDVPTSWDQGTSP